MEISEDKIKVEPGHKINREQQSRMRLKFKVENSVTKPDGQHF